jgi:murein DD-endopeptidase MepM/ murein hydrolase activator NlpD
VNLLSLEHFIPNEYQQFIVSFLLRMIRLLVRVKPYVLSGFGAILLPFQWLARTFLFGIFIPVYRVTFRLRRYLGRIDRPTKNRFTFFLANRHTIHLVVASLIILAVLLNLGTDSVRAETFGQTSLLYNMINEDGLELVEEYATPENAEQLVALHYQEQSALSSYARGIDDINTDLTTTTLVGGNSLVALPISESSASVAPREKTEEYTVLTGDSLSSIAEKFGISLNTLLWANSLTVKSIIRPGATLKILPVTGVSHTVKSGDTITKIASKYNAEADDILAFNKLASANDISVGEQLLIPGGEIIYVAPARTTAISQIFTSTPTASTTTVTGAGGMIWPSDLFVITQYYSWKHNGLDIDCAYTNQNYAAADGIVTKSGWYNGYGYLVEISHDNGIVTRYGHHKSLYVTTGQSVAQGQALGICGTTGISTGTHLHFEVRVNGATKNPLEYIR